MRCQKIVRNLLFSLIASGLIGSATIGSVTAAENPFDRFVPRGRLLRKLRDDLTGATAKQPEKPRTPTPAGKSPDQADPQNSRQPTPATRPEPSDAQSRQPAKSASAAANRRQQSKGFGMTYRLDKNESLVVSRIEPGGNAATAGIRPGDVLVKAGGATVASAEELDEIAKILGAGDELEFQISRRGKSSDVTVRYGEIPESDAVATSGDSATANNRPAARSGKGQASTGNYSFVPDAAKSDKGYRSVLDGPIMPSRSATPARPVSSSGQRSSVSASSHQKQLESTVANQRQQILQLQRQLQSLQQQRMQTPVGSGLRRSSR